MARCSPAKEKNVKPILREDDEPVALVLSHQDGRYRSIGKRPFIQASRLRSKSRALIFYDVALLGKIGEQLNVFFADSNRGPFHPEEVGRIPSAGQDVFIREGAGAFRATVVSNRRCLLHAAAFDPANPSHYQPIPFMRTKVPEHLWPRTGYTAVVRHGVLNYATSSPIGPAAIGRSFGEIFEQGSFTVIPIGPEGTLDPLPFY
jgi:hypothetical protein